MHFSKHLLVLLPLVSYVSAGSKVVGAAEGFAKGVTGGGNAPPQYPANIQQLTQWLTDATPRTIVLDREYNFIGSEGRVKAKGCRPATKCAGKGGQDAINQANWCTNGNAGLGAEPQDVDYDKAGVAGINVQSNKSILGIGKKGVIRGKGLRIANGAKNIIIQNIHITELNPQYIWGGDAITIAGSDLVWIDHCKISLIGRQFIVLGTNASGRVTITNNELDGVTSWSASCDNRHYWALYLTGSSDQVTLKGNYIHHTSGRSPKVGGNTLLHAVNNYWESNTGHAFDIEKGSNVLAEGNVFQNVNQPLLSTSTGNLFASPDVNTNKQCSPALKRVCAVNAFGASGAFPGTNNAVLTNFNGKNVAGAAAANAGAIKAGAGTGLV